MLRANYAVIGSASWEDWDNIYYVGEDLAEAVSKQLDAASNGAAAHIFIELVLPANATPEACYGPQDGE